MPERGFPVRVMVMFVAVSPEFSATLFVPRAHEEMRAQSVGISLEVLSGEDEGKVFRFAVEGESGRVDCLVGGRRDCDIVLSDPSISTRHFELAFEGKGVRLRDLQSRNGLWIGRARIEEAWLAPGCEFFVGQCKIRVSGIDMQEMPVSTEKTLGTMAGASEASRAMFSLLERVAPTPMTILVMGESGVGKGEVARTIHAVSGRKGPFHLLDCSTLPRELSAALVLGHAKGAYTGATTDRPGPFELADGGTLFLDEVGELPLDVQQNLLTVVDRREVQRVGESRIRKVDVRVVAATNRNLAGEVAAGRFRQDLYFRLRQFVVTVPPLRDRPEDIDHLAGVFLEEFAKDAGRRLSLSREALKELRRPRWDGNVRQLRDVMRRAAYLSIGDVVGKSDLNLFEDEVWVDTSEQNTGDDEQLAVAGGLKAATEAFQRRYCERLLASVDGDAVKAAALAKYTSRGFSILLERLGLATKARS